MEKELMDLHYSLPLDDKFTRDLISHLYYSSHDRTKEIFNKGEIIYINVNIRIDKNRKENK
jgi:hypothetical protein